MCDDNSLPVEALEAAGCFNNTTNAVPDIVANILYTIIGLVGIIAVIFVVIGGIKYMTSAGDSEKVKTAKKTISYAVLGIIVTALAFAIVNFTIMIINNNASNNGSDTSNPTNSQTENSNDSGQGVHLLANTQINVNDEPIKLKVIMDHDTSNTPKLTWTSSNPNVATVDANGKVTPKSAGTTTVTVKTPDGSTSSTKVTVTPPILASNIVLSTEELTMETGKKQEIGFALFPNNSTNKAVTWSSSDKKIATVDNRGIIQAKKEGKAVITASTSNGIKASANVTVVKPEPTWSENGGSAPGQPIEITQNLLSNLDRYYQTNYTGSQYSFYMPNVCGGKTFYNGVGVGAYSCGPAAYLAAAYTLTGRHVDYMAFMRESAETGFLHCGEGANISVVTSGRYKTFYEKKYGVSIHRTAKNWDAMVAELKKGHVLMHLIKNPPSYLAGVTHFVVSLSYRDRNGGEIYIWNPVAGAGRNKGDCSKGQCWYTKSEYMTLIINASIASPWVLQKDTE